ncbi:hypothetical protein KR084_000778 [Drosophila pseudotakahashii]|nr:hypothetical protein KR084_000778 [Drosophila pseudotakahashii]
MFRSLVLLQFVVLPCLVLAHQRIINGNTVNIKDVPWYASVLVRSSLKCSGVIVTSNYILTAAKCVNGYSAGSIQVRLATSSCESGGSTLAICGVKIHSQYSKRRFDNNLALLKTCELIIETDKIKSIERIDKLPDDNSPANITGCGARSGNLLHLFYDLRFIPILPAQLYGTEVKILNLKQCAADWKLIFFYIFEKISDLNICTQSSGKGASSYDMGAPLVVDNKLVGILSRAGCSVKPDVYSNVLKHTNWLDSNTK